MIKVLLIEDEVDIRESIRDFLNFEKFDVYTAPNGQLGIKKAEEVVPDIILCDILMPDLNGFEVLKQLMKNPLLHAVPFIFLTGLMERTHIRQGMELGADDYLPKPFTQDELLKTIHARLKKQTKQEDYFKIRIDHIKQEVAEKLIRLQTEIEEKKNIISEYSKNNEMLSKQLKEKELELLKDTFNAIEVNNKLQEIQSMVKNKLQHAELSEESKKILSELKAKASTRSIIWNNLTIFQLKFNQVYPEFITTLNQLYPRLTQYEIVFLSAHLMGLNTNQLADLFNISEGSVRKSRHRLKRKLGLTRNDDFLNFIHGINQKSKQ